MTVLMKFGHKTFGGSFLVAAILVLLFTLQGNSAPASPGKVLSNFDLREGQISPHALMCLQHDFCRQLASKASVDIDPISGYPNWIRAEKGYLSFKNNPNNSKAIDFDATVRTFLAENSAAFGFGPEVLDPARVTRLITDSQSGLQTKAWQQYYQGIPVHEGLLVAHLTAEGELVSISSRFCEVKNLSAILPPASPALTNSSAILETRSLIIAAANVGLKIGENEVLFTATSNPDSGFQTLNALSLAEPAHTRKVWFPLRKGQLQLAWQVIFRGRQDFMYQVVIDSETGEILQRHCLTEAQSPATYRIYIGDSPTPLSPGYSNPTTTQPPEIARVLTTLIAINTNASPSGWINDGVNVTTGNNVDAFVDSNGDTLPDAGRPEGNPFRVFDFPLDLSQDPGSYGSASVVNLFYWNNWMHDQLYSLGFVESAGNFQRDNFGKGGIGSDAVIATAQLGGASGADNNAFFSTPPDGLPGVMQMYLWTGPSPNRDGDLDTQVILHEYTHGLSNRRVGGGVGISELQSRGLGEGWSDFMSLALLGQSGDDPAGTHPEGAYVAYGFNGLAQNYYFGLRRYPYSTDLTKSPVTFKDIDPNQIDSHAGVPINPALNAQASEVHNQGEVWCAMLWDARKSLIAKYGFAIGNSLIQKLVVDGMNLAPANPNFVQARDAILQADLVDNRGTNYQDLWRAFAHRGLGLGAVAPANSTTTGVVESFLVPDPLYIADAQPFSSSGPFQGPFTPAWTTYTLWNATTNPLPWHFSNSIPWLGSSSVSGILPGCSSTNLTLFLNSVASNLDLGLYTGVVGFINDSTGTLQTQTVALMISAPRLAYFGLDTDPGWMRQGQWAFGVPNGLGGARHGFPDPSSGTTGSNVFGVNLIGDYATNSGSVPFYLTTAPINCSGVENVSLQFQRWLNTDASPYASATVDVSNDGMNWTNVFSNDADPIADSSWTPVQFDISPWADGYPAVYVRWGYAATQNAFPYSGWNLDDISLSGLFAIRVSGPVSVTEGDGLLKAAGAISISRSRSTETMVNLTSGNPMKVSVPKFAIIPAGQTTTTFDITVGQDGLLDGTQMVNLTANAAGCIPGITSIVVFDNESAVLNISLPASASQGDGVIQGTVTSDTVPASDIPIVLTSSDTNRLFVTGIVLLPAGQSSVSFNATIIDDGFLDGDSTVMVTAQSGNWSNGTTSITIHDNKSAQILVTLPFQLRPSNGVRPDAGLLQISAIPRTNVPISLRAASNGELIIPAQVVIPAGSTSSVFSLGMAAIVLPTGNRSNLVTASANGFSSSTASVTLIDDQTPPAPGNPAPSHLSTNNPNRLKLSWSGGAGEGVELIQNGDFEAGDLRYWLVVTNGNGNCLANNGTLAPVSMDSPTLPNAGTYCASIFESRPSLIQMSQDVVLPDSANSIWLTWFDRIRNFGSSFSTNQQFRVELEDIAGNPLMTLFATKPGQNELNDWIGRAIDLSSFRGKSVRLVFQVNGGESFLDVHLDNISIRAATLPPTSYDVFFGNTAQPGTQWLLGTTTNTWWDLPLLAPFRTNYWQIVARRTQSIPSPLWQFCTLPTLVVKDTLVAASDTGQTNVAFKFSLLGNPTETVRVNYATRDQTALSPSDYLGSVGTLVFPPGVTNQTLNVLVNGNAISPTRSWFTVILSNPSNTILDTNIVAGTIWRHGSVPLLLSEITNRLVQATSLLQFGLQASDAPLRQISYSLDSGAPSGVLLGANGVFTWTPAVTEGPGTYWINARVTDDGTPAASDSQGFFVQVQRLNVPPVITPIPNQVVHSGGLLSFQVTATDLEVPQNALSFSLKAGAPAGASIDPITGVFSWMPDQSSAGTSNTVTVMVSVNLTPSLSSTMSFGISVVQTPTLQASITSNGQVSLSWSALANQGYRIHFTSDLTMPWSDLLGAIFANSPVESVIDSNPPAGSRFYRLEILAAP